MSTLCAKKRKLHGNSLALQRWNILREILLNGKSTSLTSENAVSVRRFKSFGLLHTELETEASTDDGVNWFTYTISKWPHFKMHISHLLDHVKPEALTGFNNTGNVCVWPAEEILAYYCLNNQDMFSGKSVIELGGGMTCLAGVALSIMSDISYMELTDGNEDSVSNLDKIITRNSDQFKDTTVSSRVLRWGIDDVDDDLSGVFDFVICADCFFFEEGRADLVKTIHQLLKHDGEAILFAPRRGDTFDAFVDLAKDLFNVCVKERYDDTVWDIHGMMQDKGIEAYDSNIHYPLFLQMSKKQSRENSSDR